MLEVLLLALEPLEPESDEPLALDELDVLDELLLELEDDEAPELLPSFFVEL